MTIKSLFATALIAVCAVVHAEQQDIHPFNVGSYQQILDRNAGKPFVLAIWSVDCPSCLKDMDILRQLRQNRPELRIVMLATDEPSALPEVRTVLARSQLADLDNWLFADEDAQKLRYDIDPAWHGELPRTYFFSAEHKRAGKSGALSLQEFEEHINAMTR